MTAFEFCRGKHVCIREMTEADAPHVVEWRNRADTKKWLIQWRPLTVEAHLRWFSGRQALGDLILMYEAHDGRPIAMTSLQDFDGPQTMAEWGRLCAASVGGNGHAVLEGCYLLHRMCFETLGMRRLVGTVAADNKRPFRLYQFLGYRQEGLRRRHWVHPGGHFDVVEVGAFPEEFDAARPAVERKLYGDAAPPSIGAAQAACVRQHVRIGQRCH